MSKKKIYFISFLFLSIGWNNEALGVAAVAIEPFSRHRTYAEVLRLSLITREMPEVRTMPREMQDSLIATFHFSPPPTDTITGFQIDGILKIYKSSAEVVLDPTRPGDDFSEQEKGLAIAITQIVPNNETCCLKALALVFSSERAKKILESIVEG